MTDRRQIQEVRGECSKLRDRVSALEDSFEEQNNLNQRLLKVEEHLWERKGGYNLSEACRYLRISTSYMYKLTSKKKISFYKPNGKIILFRKSDLDEWMFNNRINASTLTNNQYHG